MRKLACFVLGFASGTLISVYLVPTEFLPYICAAALIAACGGLLLRGRRRLAALLIAIGAAFGALWCFGYDSVVVLPARELDGAEGLFHARVSDFPVERDYGAYVDIRLETGGYLPAKTRAYIFNELPELRPGDEITFTASISVPDEERAGSYAADGILLFAMGTENIRVISSTGVTITNFHRYAAREIKTRILDLFPDKTVGFMLALLTGDRTVLNEDTELTNALSRAGISHIVAVSGMHVSILAGFVALLLGKRSWARLAAIPVLLAFMGMTGFSASVVRAVVMQVMLLTAPLIMRESDSLTSLSAALFLILLANPHSAEGAGLQMSFAATLGIIVFAPRICAALTGALSKKKRTGRILKGLIAAASTTTSALLVTLPLSAIYFRTISLAAPVVNVLISWLITPTFIIGIMAVALGCIFEPLGGVIAVAAGALAALVCGVARLAAGSFLASVVLEGLAMTLWFTGVYSAILLFIALRLDPRTLIPIGSCAVTALCAILVINSLVADSGGGYTLTVLDVGQGQCIVVTSGAYTAVIDCGSSSGEDAGGIAERFIRSLGRDRIDVLALTHYHSDHANGVRSLFSSLDVDVFSVPVPLFEESSLDERVLDAAEREGCEILFIEDRTVIELGETSITLFPPLGLGTENERCAMFLVESGGFETLITGDADSSMELQLLGKYDLPDIECLIVGHHGSATSTGETLLDELTPEIALISVGENTYGHPTDAVLERLQERGIEILRTDIYGNITISAGDVAGGQ